jgi:hypothetical protein
MLLGAYPTQVAFKISLRWLIASRTTPQAICNKRANGVDMLTGHGIDMKFSQSSPLTGHRPNLILSAIIEIDRLNRLACKSASLSKVLPPLRTDGSLAELVNELAYSSIEKLVPGVIVETAQLELEEMPIEMHEIIEVLSKPIGSALELFQVFQGQEA